MSNVGFRNPKLPNSPAFDWLPFHEAVETHDRTLQESIADYNPECHVLVFVFLLSHSGKSLAMWRRRLYVPNVVLKQHHAEVTQVIDSLASYKYQFKEDA